ncbi:hypothetical protein ACFVX4_35480, partial [Streptomyces sp. NPDC058240]
DRHVSYDRTTSRSSRTKGEHPDCDQNSEQALAVLPPYIARPASVDNELRCEVAEAADGSRLVMVVGGSSTGKTRSCWEAVRAELPTWKIVHPLAPDRPAALLQALQEDVLQPRTVLWLNEANLYLLVKDYAAEVSASLQDLLTNQQRGPVLVLGTMWPSFWEKLTECSVEDDDHLNTGMGAVGQLADLAVTVRMPAAFSEPELARAETVFLASSLRLSDLPATTRRLSAWLAGRTR